MTSEETRCHCSERIHMHDDGFSRDMCYECDLVRCDAYPGACTSAETRPDRDALSPCGEVVAGGHNAYDPDCSACAAYNSDAPEWTI